MLQADRSTLLLSVCGDGWFILCPLISQCTIGVLKPATHHTHSKDGEHDRKTPSVAVAVMSEALQRILKIYCGMKGGVV